MKEDQEEFMLSSHRLKMKAQQGVNLEKYTLKELMSNEEEKTGDTTMVTASDTSIVAVENSAGNATVAIVPGTMKPAPGAPATAEIGPFFGKGKNRTELTKVVNIEFTIIHVLTLYLL